MDILTSFEDSCDERDTPQDIKTTTEQDDDVIKTEVTIILEKNDGCTTQKDIKHAN
jgi:hypothetical protein